MKLSPNLRKTEIIREKEKAAAGAAAAGDGPKKPPPKKKGEADPNAAEAKVLPTQDTHRYTHYTNVHLRADAQACVMLHACYAQPM